MVKFDRNAVAALVCLLTFASAGSSGRAEALDPRVLGAWAKSKSDCSALFEKTGGGWAYRQPVDKFAQAAIFKPGRILAPAAICRVINVSRSSDGIAIKAECSDSVSIKTQTASVKIQSASEIIYNPTGDPAMGTTLVKCSP